MPSKSYQSFKWNLVDVQRLEHAHEALNPIGQGRRALGHITRSGLIMLCASWELYIEDVIEESVAFLCNNIVTPNVLPPSVKKKIIKHLNDDPNELALFGLAGDGWKTHYKAAARIEVARFNTPKSEPVGMLFKNYLGITNISSQWTIGATTVNGIIAARGEIAHRGRNADYISLDQLIQYKKALHTAILDTEGYLAEYLKRLSGSPQQPWRRASTPKGL